MSKIAKQVLWTLLLLNAGQALAYIGPGAGISVVGSLLSILATFFVAIGAILFWPVRKMLKRRKARREALNGVQNGGNAGPNDESGGGRQS